MSRGARQAARPGVSERTRTGENGRGRGGATSGTRGSGRSHGDALDERRPRSYRDATDDRTTAKKTPKGWGSVTRRGAAAVEHSGDGKGMSEYDEARQQRAPERHARTKWSAAVGDPDARPKRSPKPRKQSAAAPIPAAAAAGEGEWRLPPDTVRELAERAGAKRGERLAKYLKDAARAYASERWGDARKALRPLLAETPDAPAVQELNGMVLYRTGKWAAAIKELQLAHAATNSYDLYPAIMDCHRALKQSDKVSSLWEDLKLASPAPDVMFEGRIVFAASVADGGQLNDAIAVLEKSPKPRRKVQIHHLRSWYALADLYDRAGETGKARTLFERVAVSDPDMGDVHERLAALD